ncbi:MAG TPA: hypothetical protein VKY81_07365 [Natronosporangium sp.]|nr:hypothetical protein [Natronosporangium sp.]
MEVRDTDVPEPATADLDHEAGNGPAAGMVGGSTRLQTALSRVAAYLLWGAVVLAVVLGLVNLTGPPVPASLPAPGAASAPPRIPPPGGCAEIVVAGWLAGDPGVVAGIAGQPARPPSTEPGRRAAHTYTAAVTPSTDGTRWGYLVGVDVEHRDENGSWVAAGRQFYTVTLAEGGGCAGWGAVAPPARVAAPALAATAGAGYPVRLPASGTPLTETLGAFFTAVLTGTGSADRYVAPGLTVPVLESARYDRIELADVRAAGVVGGEGPAAGAVTAGGTAVPPDGTVLHLLVTVVADPDGDPLPLVYPVTAGVRGGRWEVMSLDPIVGPDATTGPGTEPTP